MLSGPYRAIKQSRLSDSSVTARANAAEKSFASIASCVTPSFMTKNSNRGKAEKVRFQGNTVWLLTVERNLMHPEAQPFVVTGPASRFTESGCNLPVMAVLSLCFANALVVHFAVEQWPDRPGLTQIVHARPTTGATHRPGRVLPQRIGTLVGWSGGKSLIRFSGTRNVGSMTSLSDAIETPLENVNTSISWTCRL
jgi:hypothetical protein